MRQEFTMKEKIKNIFSKLTLLMVGVTILANGILSPMNVAYAIDNLPDGVSADKISQIQKDLGEEAWAQLTWHVLYKCTKGSKEERNQAFKPSEIPNKDDFFSYVYWRNFVQFDEVDIPVGYYLEAQVGGKNNKDDKIDAKIHCKDNNNKILFLAAEALGLDYEQILCDGGAPGIIYDTKNSGKCDATSDKDQYKFSDNYENHLKKLWNKVKAEKGWTTTFEEQKDSSGKVINGIGYYGGVNGYMLYSFEAGARCGSSVGTFETENEKPSGQYFEPWLKYIAQDGGQSFQYFKNDKEINATFVERSFSSCSDMLNRANSDTIIDAYRKRVYDEFNARCREFYSNIVNADTDGKIAEEAMEEWRSLEASQSQRPNDHVYLSDKDDPEDEDEYDKQCVEIEGIIHPEQSESTSIADQAAQETAQASADCYTNAGSLGWIVCPIIDQISKGIQDIYEKYITPFLVLDPELFRIPDNSTAATNGTYNAWQQFRDFANIAFIIIFIVVIFSQLTGMGIDNYGIKKILPKLIVAAILINMSYIICQLCIDVANIVGYGVGAIFNGIAQYDVSQIYVEGGSATAGVGSATAIIVVLVLAFTATAILAGGPAIIIPVLMALLSIVLGVVFCFVLLAVRKAFAVILVAISPLAFVCYMLPNTKPLFKKWFDAFKAVLLAFPICSAMIYGGNMVARIIISASGLSNVPIALAISAAVIAIVPVFMIPKAIQGSMAMMAGGLIAMQNRLGGRAKDGLRRSNFAQDMQRKSQQYKSGVYFDKNGNAKRNPRGWLQDHTFKTKSGRARLNNARRAAAMTNAQFITNGGKGKEELDKLSNIQKNAMAAQEEQEVKDTQTAIALGGYTIKPKNGGEDAEPVKLNINDNNSLKNGLKVALQNGDKKQVKALQNILYGKGEDGRTKASEAMRAAQGDDGKGVSADTLQTFGENAMTNWAKDLKSNARSDYEFALAASNVDTSPEMQAKVDSGEAVLPQVSDYSAIQKAQKFTAQDMASMDDTQIEDLQKAIEVNGGTGEQLSSAVSAAQEALDNKNINLKGERRAALERLVSTQTADDKAYLDKLKEMSRREGNPSAHRDEGGKKGNGDGETIHIDHSN